MYLQLCKEVHIDESKHPSSFVKDSNVKITKCDGTGNEGGDPCHDGHEQTDELAADPENHDGV